MRLEPMEMRAVRLDQDGRPVGDPVPVAVVKLAAAPTAAPLDEGRAAPAKFARYDISFEVRTTAKMLKSLRRLFYPDQRSYLRAAHYFRRRHAHAPKRRNKHGRTGVRR